MKCAPIAIFIYNRPGHTRNLLQSLVKNPEHAESVIKIYCDGARGPSDLESVNEARRVAKDFAPSHAEFIFRDANLGLAQSIISGVTELCKAYGRVIVFEDDLVLSPSALNYFNKALDEYADNERVTHISGYMFPVQRPVPDVFFYRECSCWGWATWQRAWQHFNADAKLLLRQINEQNLRSYLDNNDSSYFYRMLEMQVEGKINSWAIRWYASNLLRGGLSLHPGKSLIKNEGFDGTGAHSDVTREFEVQMSDQVQFAFPKEVIEDAQAIRAMREFRSVAKPRTLIVKEYIKKLLSFLGLLEISRKVVYKIKNHKRNSKYSELLRLERFVEHKIKFLNHDLQIVDGPSFYSTYREIFLDEIYKFKSASHKPYILDCGANIGLATIYLKRAYPNAEVVCFEPDARIYNVLKANINSFGFKDVQLIQKGLWSFDGNLEFHAEGADGGRIRVDGDKDKIVQVPVTRLSPYLNRSVDFLKIDIEGAEFEVLKEIQIKLNHVQNIFIEYHSFANQPQCLPELLSILKQAGFRLNVVSHGPFGVHPLHETTVCHGMDLQLNIFGKRT